MEQSEKHHIALVGSLPKTFFTSLRSADDVCLKLPISSARLLELADGGYVPHYRIDGSAPMFKYQEVQDWIKYNLLVINPGKDLPLQGKVYFEVVGLPDDEYNPTSKPPPEISHLNGLRQMPVHRISPGVYFLCKDKSVVYVGQSTTIESRVSCHVREGRKGFDSIFFVNVPAFALDDVEGAFIRLLKPKLNGTPPTLKVADSDNDALQRFVYDYGLNDCHGTIP